MQKPFYSKWWFWGIVALVIIAVVGGKNSVPKEEVKLASTEPKQEVKNETKKENKPEVKKAEPMKEGNKEGISKAEFDQIQNGMTYEEVKTIIGSDGEVMSESGQKGQQFYTIMYSWNGEQGLGANANFIFQEEKLQSKAQFGLK